MANLFEAGVTKTTSTAAGIIACLWPTASVRAEIFEIGVFATTAAAGEVALGRPANTPAGTLTGVLGQATDGADVAAVSTLVTSFGTTNPTAPTNPMRRIQLPAVIGAGVVWVWGPGELIAPASVGASAGILIWQLSIVAVTYDVYMKWRE